MADRLTTQAERAKAYDALRARASTLGFPTVGHALDQVGVGQKPEVGQR